MIDPRFPPSPSKISVPLYPLEGKVPLVWNHDTSLNEFFAKKLCSSKNFLFSNSGTSALCIYLKWLSIKRNEKIRIALPSFNCPQLAKEIVQVGAVPIFLDIDDNYGISRSSVMFAQEKKANVILWPNFFGDRKRSQDVIDLIATFQIELILDEAQSFPYAQMSDKHVSIFSFGKSKRIQGLYGGGIYIPSNSDLVKFSDFFYRYLQKSKMTFLYRIRFKKERSKGRETELPALLEKQLSKAEVESVYTDISRYERNIIIKNYRKIELYSDRLTDLKRKLSSFFEYFDLPVSLSALENVYGCPTIFAVRVPHSRRHEISKELSDLGIQTTWYYYPLNRLSFFKRYESEKTVNTDRLSSEILIVPYGLGVTMHKYDGYIKILERSIDARREN